MTWMDEATAGIEAARLAQMTGAPRGDVLELLHDVEYLLGEAVLHRRTPLALACYCALRLVLEAME